MCHPEEVEVVRLEERVRIVRLADKRLNVYLDEQRPVATPTDCHVRVAGGYDRLSAAKAGRTARAGEAALVSAALGIRSRAHQWLGWPLAR